MYHYTIQQYIDRLERFIAQNETITVNNLFELQFSTWICIDGTCVHQLLLSYGGLDKWCIASHSPNGDIFTLPVVSSDLTQIQNAWVEHFKA